MQERRKPNDNWKTENSSPPFLVEKKRVFSPLFFWKTPIYVSYANEQADSIQK